MSITLYTSGNLSHDFSDPDKDLKARNTYVKALVVNGTWIMYREKNFNNDIPAGEPEDVQIVNAGEQADISSHNGSMFPLPVGDDNALVLFNHRYYGGIDPEPQVYTEQGYPDITDVFPTGANHGVSSAIVLSQISDWELFTETGFHGDKFPLQRQQRYGQLPREIEDKVKSLRKE